MNFELAKCDYVVRANPGDMDILRILRECRDEENSEYVVVMTPIHCVVFMTKKFTNRIKALNVLTVYDIINDKKYGFNVATVTGNMIRSIGFTSGRAFEYSEHDNVMSVLENLDSMEADAAKALAEKKKGLVEVKVTCG